MDKQQKEKLEQAICTLERYLTSLMFDAQLRIDYLKALQTVTQAEKNLLLPNKKEKTQ